MVPLRDCSSDRRSDRVWCRCESVPRKAVGVKSGVRKALRARGCGNGRSDVSEYESSGEYVEDRRLEEENPVWRGGGCGLVSFGGGKWLGRRRTGCFVAITN